MRRAKIVCTLGPATSSAEQIRALVDGGHGRRPAQPQPRQLRRPRGGLPRRAPGRPTRRGRGGRRPGRPAGPEDPARPVRRRPGACSPTATRSRSPPRTSPATQTSCSTTYTGLPGDVAGRRPHPHRRRQGRASRSSTVDGPRVVTEVDRGRRWSPNNKGINLPGVAVSVPALSEKDEADLRWGLQLRRRPHRAVVRAAAPTTSSACTRSWTRRASGSRSSPRSRSRRPSTTSRRSSRRSTASWSPAATSASSCRSRRCRSCRSARSSWRAAAAKPVIVATQMLESMIATPRPDPRRGLRRRQRGARRRRRGDAVRRDQRGRVPARVACATMARIIETDRGPRPRAHPAARHAARAPRAARSRTRPPRSASSSTPSTSCAFTADRRLGPPDVAAALARSRCSRSRPSRRSARQLALTWGVETFLDPHGRRTPTRWSRRSTRRCSTIGRCERGDEVVIVAGSPPGIPGSTNALRVHRIGDAVIGRGPAYPARDRYCRVDHAIRV